MFKGLGFAVFFTSASLLSKRVLQGLILGLQGPTLWAYNL